MPLSYLKKHTDLQKMIKKPTLVMQNGFVQPYSSNGLFQPRSSGLCCFCLSLLPFFCDNIVFTLSSICCRCPCTWTSFLGCVNPYSMTASLHFCRLYVIRTFLWKCQGETLQIGDLCNTSFWYLITFMQITVDLRLNLVSPSSSGPHFYLLIFISFETFNLFGSAT